MVIKRYLNSLTLNLYFLINWRYFVLSELGRMFHLAPFVIEICFSNKMFSYHTDDYLLIYKQVIMELNLISIFKTMFTYFKFL